MVGARRPSSGAPLQRALLQAPQLREVERAAGQADVCSGRSPSSTMRTKRPSSAGCRSPSTAVACATPENNIDTSAGPMSARIAPASWARCTRSVDRLHQLVPNGQRKLRARGQLVRHELRDARWRRWKSERATMNCSNASAGVGLPRVLGVPGRAAIGTSGAHRSHQRLLGGEVAADGAHAHARRGARLSSSWAFRPVGGERRPRPRPAPCPGCDRRRRASPGPARRPRSRRTVTGAAEAFTGSAAVIGVTTPIIVADRGCDSHEPRTPNHRGRLRPAVVGAAVLCLSLLIVFVGNSSLNVAIPTLSRELHATESQLQWVVAGLFARVRGPACSHGRARRPLRPQGRAPGSGSRCSRRRAAPSQSTNMGELIACRALMGAAAALIMPSTLSIIVNIFPPGERPKAIAIWASITGAAGALGPVASGYLLGHFWFGSIFLINVPVIVIALVSGKFLIPKSRDPERGDPRPDRRSAVDRRHRGARVRADRGARRRWVSPTTMWRSSSLRSCWSGSCSGSCTIDEPMLDMHYFRHPAFSTGTGGMILVFLSMYGVHVPHHPVFPARARLQRAVGRTAAHADRRDHARGRAVHATDVGARWGANRVVAFGMLAIAAGFALFGGLDRIPPTPTS